MVANPFAGLSKFQPRTHAIATFTLIWGILLVLVLSWQAFAYRGLVAWLAEWQFAKFQRFYPLATIALITFVLILPMLIVLLIRSSRRRTGKLLLDEPYALIRRAQLATRDLLAAAVFAAVLAGLIGFYALWIGRGAEAVTTITGATVDPSAMGERLTVAGTLRNDRLAYYGNEAILFQRDVWVVPLQERGNGPIRFFVEVKATRPAAPMPAQITAYADTNGVPGPLAKLYEYAGYKLAKRTVVLYSSIHELRSPYVQAARTLLVLALLLGLTGLYERRWMQRLTKQFTVRGD